MSPSDWSCKVIMVYCDSINVIDIRFHFLHQLQAICFRDIRDGGSVLANFKYVGVLSTMLLKGGTRAEGCPISVLQIRNSIKEAISNILIKINFLAYIKFIDPRSSSSFRSFDALENRAGIAGGKLEKLLVSLPGELSLVLSLKFSMSNAGLIVVTNELLNVG